MLEEAQHELCEIRRLVVTPTPDNFLNANTKLASLAAFVSQLATTAHEDLARNPGVREFLRRLPAEMARVRALMQAPTLFYQSLDDLRAQYFGAYERSGTMRNLEPRSTTRTVVHL